MQVIGSFIDLQDTEAPHTYSFPAPLSLSLSLSLYLF